MSSLSNQPRPRRPPDPLAVLRTPSALRANLKRLGNAISRRDNAIAYTRQRLQQSIRDADALLAAYHSNARRAGCTPLTLSRNIALLRLRYRDGLPWANVRTELANQGYPATLRTIYNWHTSALRHLENALAETYLPKE